MKKLFLLILLLSGYHLKAQMYLTLPLDRSVFQKNNSNPATATVVIAGQVIEHPNPAILPSNFWVKYRFIPLTKEGVLPPIGSYPSWTMLGSSTPYGGYYRLEVSKNAGWYQLQVGAFDPSSADPALISTVNVGVGEVIFIAGQSNAQGIDGMTNDAVSTTYYDCVNSIDADQWCKKTYKFPVIQKITNGRYITPNANRSAWGFHYLGQKIVDGLAPTATPVLFFNAGHTSTNVANWYNTAVNPNDSTINASSGLGCCSKALYSTGDGPIGQPYLALRTSLNYFGGMFGARGVIWHQGEADNTGSTTQANYSTRLNGVIDYTQSHFNTDLKWAISRVSYVSGITKAAITGAQLDVKTGTNASYTSTGAWDSDIITARSDGLHFNASGLVTLNNQYHTSYSTGNTYTALKALTPVPAIISNQLTVVKTTGNVTISAPSATSYCWVENNGNINSCYATTQSIVVNNSLTKSYRCYIKGPTGNVTLSPAIYTPMWGVGGAPARMAAEETPRLVEDDEQTVYLNVFPNPAKGESNATFNLKETSNVKLDLFNQQGVAISTIAEGPHTAGKHSYPIPVETLPAGTYLTVLKVGELFLTKKIVVNN